MFLIYIVIGVLFIAKHGKSCYNVINNVGYEDIRSYLMTYYNMQPFRKKKAFTLTEVLVAVGIVGVIAALVMPALISNYQTKAMNQNYSRIKQTLTDSLRGLAVSENKVNFGDTSMWLASEPTSYDGNAGLFLKKYLRVSEYLGEGTSTKAKESFADKYYSYDNADGSSSAGKSRKIINPDTSGACAILKNGATICLKPQVGATPAHGIIDLNGKEGPNVLNRDYWELTLSTIEFSDVETELLTNTVPTEILTEDHENIIPNDEIPCGVDDYSVECCRYKAEKGAVTGPDHQCCQNPAVASQISVCANDIALRVNLYPSQCKLNKRQGSIPKCSQKPYVLSTNTTATQNGKKISKLPSNPPNLYLFCDGKKVGYMPSSTFRQAIETNSVSYPFTITFPSCFLSCPPSKNPTCGYQSGEGIKSTKSSVVFTESGTYKDYKYNNINWSVTYY